ARVPPARDDWGLCSDRCDQPGGGHPDRWLGLRCSRDPPEHRHLSPLRGKRGDANERAIYGASFGFIGIGFARFCVPKLPLSPSLIDALLPLAQRISLVILCWGWRA